MPNTYEMDSISSSTMQRVQARDLSPYDTIRVSDQNAIDFLENQRQAVEANTYANNMRRNATTKNGGWNDRQIYEEQKAEASKYSKKAAEALEKIDVAALSKDDYMQVLNAQVDSKRGNCLDEDIATKLTCRYIAVNANDKQMTAMIDGCSKSARDELLKNAKDMYPELIPPDEEIKKQAAEVKSKIADGDPRPDIKNPDAINKYVLEASNKVCEAHLKEETERLAAYRNNPAPAHKTFYTTGLKSFDEPSNTNNGMSL